MAREEHENRDLIKIERVGDLAALMRSFERQQLFSAIQESESGAKAPDRPGEMSRLKPRPTKLWSGLQQLWSGLREKNEGFLVLFSGSLGRIGVVIRATTTLFCDSGIGVRV